jgi:hypothetical protein
LNSQNEVVESETKLVKNESDFNMVLPLNITKFRVISNLVDSNGSAFFDHKSQIDFKSLDFLKNSCKQEGDYKSSGKSVAICGISGDDIRLSFTAKHEGRKQTNQLFFKVLDTR